MKKDIIRIITIAVLGGLVVSGCTYSKGKMPVFDMGSGIEESPEGNVDLQEPSPEEGATGGEEDLITPPSGAPMDETEAPSVEFVAGSQDKQLVIIEFSGPVDFSKILQNDSIQFYGTKDGTTLRIEGELTQKEFLPNRIRFTAAEEFSSDRVYSVKILGADSMDPSKAVVDPAQNKLSKEYARTLMCNFAEPLTLTDGVVGCQGGDVTPPKLLAPYGTQYNQTLDFYFSEAIDFNALVQHNSLLIYTTSGIVPGAFSAQGPAQVRFTADQTFETGEVYIIHILGADSEDPSKALIDMAGNKLEATHKQKLLCSTGKINAPGVIWCE